VDAEAGYHVALRAGGTRPVVHPVTTLPVAFVSDAILPVVRSPDLDWHVHSVFRQALNLDAGGRLIAVAPQAAGGLPNGMSVSGHPDFRALGVAMRMAVTGSWPSFEIADAGILFDLARAWSWSPRLRAGTIDPHDTTIQRRVEVAAEVVAARATRVGFAQCVTLLRPALVGAAADARSGGSRPAPLSWEPAGPPGSAASIGLHSIETLRRAVAAHDLPAAIQATDALVGLGEGLTPSGDDLLVGLTAALRATGHPMAGSLSRHAAFRAVDSTTDVARVALEHAARGDYPERLHDVLEAVAHGDDASLRVQVERALSWGASSGADALLGILIGLEAAAAA